MVLNVNLFFVKWDQVGFYGSIVVTNLTCFVKVLAIAYHIRHLGGEIITNMWPQIVRKVLALELTLFQLKISWFTTFHENVIASLN